MKAKKEYAKITEYDVYRLLFGLEIDPMIASVGYWLTTKSIASLLNTSYYQANKHLKALSDQGAVEGLKNIKSRMINKSKNKKRDGIIS